MHFIEANNSSSEFTRTSSLMLIAVLVVTTFSAVAQTIRVDITSNHSGKSFVPTAALGAGIDRIPTAATDKVFTEPVLKQVLSAGWQPLSYRQNTELFIEAWHWNPRGTWSDSSGKGYFVGDANPTEFIRHSFGYFLPRRGFTRNDGTDRDGYSRMTDGDENTYWKSNPYLRHSLGKTIRCTRSGLLWIWQTIIQSTLSAFHGQNLTHATTFCSTGPAKIRSSNRPKGPGWCFRVGL